MNKKDNEVIDEIIYLLNEYYSKEYTKKEFEKKIKELLDEHKISEETAEIVVKKIFKFKHDSNYGMVWQGGSCGGSYVKRPHLGHVSPPSTSGGC